MGHRHTFGSRIFEASRDQNWNLTQTDQSYMHQGRAGISENGTFAFRMENMPSERVNASSNWNSAPRSNMPSSSSLRVELPYRQVPISGSSSDSFRQWPAARSFCPVQQIDINSSSSHDGHIVRGVEGGIIDMTMGNARDSSTRKRPAGYVAYERGSTSRNISTGSSFNLSVPSNSLMRKPNSTAQHWPREIVRMTPSNRLSTLSTAGEAFQRNVRSRSTVDLDGNLVGTYISNNASYQPPLEGRLAFHPDTGTGTILGARAAALDRNRMLVSAVTQRGNLVSDTYDFRHDTVPLGVGSGIIAGSMDIDGHHDLISRRYPAVSSQNFHVPTPQTLRVGPSSYAPRIMPAFRSRHSYQHSGPVAVSPQNAHVSVPESYSSSYLRPLPRIGLPNGNSSGRSRIPHHRPYLLLGAANANDGLLTEGFMMMDDDSAWYDYPDHLDQHRDMRLEIDDMGYEELLALGERIGSVKTGLSKDSMSKCFREARHFSSDRIKDESKCVICLEEYKNGDMVATLRNCSHNYHTSCIKKWLAEKNACPICKVPAAADS